MKRPPDPARRAATRVITAAAGALALAGCGFQLRRSAGLPFRRLALTGFRADSALAAGLRRELAGTVEIVDTPAAAEVVLHAVDDRQERSVVASTSAGQVREIQLRLSFTARADTPTGRPLLAPFALHLTRELSYSESAALAKEQEEASLFREMQLDVLAQVLRRLATARP